MSEQLEDFTKRFNLSLPLKLDLRMHEGELFLSLVRIEIPADVEELNPGLLDLVLTNQHTRTVWHEGGETDEKDDSPWDLDGEWETPLDSSIWGVAACESNPVGGHGAQADAAS